MPQPRLACQVYFCVRVAHLLAYTGGIPWVRTVAFAVGFVCQLTVAWQLLN